MYLLVLFWRFIFSSLFLILVMFKQSWIKCVTFWKSDFVPCLVVNIYIVEKDAAIMTPRLQVSLSPEVAHAQITAADQLTVREAFGNTGVSLWISNPKTAPLKIIESNLPSNRRVISFTLKSGKLWRRNYRFKGCLCAVSSADLAVFASVDYSGLGFISCLWYDALKHLQPDIKS